MTHRSPDPKLLLTEKVIPRGRVLLQKMGASGSCPVAGFVISGVEPSGSATTVLVSKMDLREIGCEDGRWMELAQDRVQCQ
jgi:hypothetical protein